MIHLSFDQDWAPPWATLDVHNLLKDAGVSGTLFVTHVCPSLESMGSNTQAGLCELGWHPNFLPGSSQGATQKEVLDTLAQWLPEAVGVRGHFLVRSTALWLEYGRRGLLYDSSDLLDGQTHLQPLKAWNNLARLPIFWEDDVHMAHGRPFDLSAIDLESPGMKVFDFHPVHIALNGADMDAYADLKRHLTDTGTALTQASREDFEPFVRRDSPGPRTVLVQLLDWLQAHPDQQGGPLRNAVKPA